MATNQFLKAGHVLTVTAGSVKASVHQIEDASIGAVLQPAFSKSFGPYLVDRHFNVSDGATIADAEYTASLGGLLTSNAGAPVTAVAAMLAVNPTGDDNALTFTAKSYGAEGNGITIRYVDPGGTTAALAVSVVGQAISVSLARAASAITSTAAAIKAAIEADPAANALVSVSILTSDSGSADDGTGIVTAMSQTPLAGGAGSLIGSALPGCICVDTTNADIYRNDGTTAAPVWVRMNDFELVVAVSDEATALTAGTAKITFRMPRAVTLTAVRASLGVAQTSGSILTVDVNEGGTSILSTKLTIDNGEKTSVTAAAPAVISDAALADDAEMTIDIDQIGDGTAKGLKVTLMGTRG